MAQTPPPHRPRRRPAAARALPLGLLALGLLLVGPPAPAGAQPASPELEEAAERRFLSAEQFYRGGRHAQALRDYETVLQAMAESSLADDAALRIAFHRFEVEANPMAAAEMAERVLTEFPAGDAIPGAHLLLGRIAAESVPPRPEDAAAEFERALTAAGPEGSAWSFAALHGIARAAAGRADDEEAAGALLSALYETDGGAAGERERFEARYLLALSLARAGRSEGALGELAPLRADLLRRVRDLPASAAPPAGGAGTAAAGAPPAREGEWVAALARRAAALSLAMARFRDPAGPRWTFAGAVRPPRRLDEPRSLRLAGGLLHLLDRDTREVQVFSEDGVFEKSMSTRNPWALAVDPGLGGEAESDPVVIAAEDLLVVGGNGLTLRAPDRDGRAEPLRRIRAAAVAPEGYWVWDDRREQVLRFARSGLFLGPAPHPPLERVRVIARHPEGHLVVVTERDGALAFAADGRRVFHLDRGPALEDPVDLVFDDLGHSYLLDREGPRVLVFDREFREVAALSGEAFAGGVRRPVSLDVGADGALFLLDEATGAVGVLR